MTRQIMSPEGRISRRANIATKTGRTNGKACERCHDRKVRCDMLQKVRCGDIGGLWAPSSYQFAGFRCANARASAF
ncbi:hypothetical protein VDGE_30712 [Verticillium dahliae]|uniref:Zn(2)-C6 fungal-type domain-containing protein n=1 Tax=Verticillium dahliae TaxID=27337 RepID=A0A444RL55_VERDA|nr:hypothetical protein VDGE_30712 [Verticillium dahliae]